MALTALQRTLLSLLAGRRVARGNGDLLEGVAPGETLGSTRLSRDVDTFSDTAEAVAASFHGDRRLLEEAGCKVTLLRELPGLVEARVELQGDTAVFEWARDSAYRFFPLVEHPLLGLTLHPLDLATNKVLALVGRLEVRDWIDVLESHRTLQPLGYLTWAACGKDPGFGPDGILAHARRTGRYTPVEVDSLDFAGRKPDAKRLAEEWHSALDDAERLVRRSPPEQLGTCVLRAQDEAPLRVPEQELELALSRGEVLFHAGRIGGAWPRPRQ